MTSAIGSWIGRASSSAVHGRTMTRRSPELSGLSRHPSGSPRLRRDYQAMRDMYLTEPASFDDILSTLADLEKRINSVGSG